MRRRVFPSLCDPFDNDSSILAMWRWRFYRLIEDTPHLDWLLLTKRPQNIRKLAPKDWLESWPRNVWLGTTTENQVEVDRRVPRLMEFDAPVLFLSAEPLLGEIEVPRGANWVICGGESGPNARPMQPEWARSVRDQCAAYGIAFWMKQWGHWGEVSPGVMERLGVRNTGCMLDGQDYKELPRAA